MPTDIQLDDLVKASERGFRVDVVELAKKLNLTVYSVDLPDDQSGHLCDGAEPYIEVNRNHSITRQRFTIAHEISHYLIHQNLLQTKGQLDRKTTYESPEEVAIEQEADRTAAGILMPEDLVNKYFDKMKWTKLTRFTASMISDIAEAFRVSREMAVTRLRDLEIPIPYLVFA
jgi:Zn-dependent peptidase ImmA (M78 family)